MYDYTGDMNKYQAKLDAAGVDFDITDLCGCTQREISEFVWVKTHRLCPKCGQPVQMHKYQDKEICPNCKKEVEIKR